MLILPVDLLNVLSVGKLVNCCSSSSSNMFKLPYFFSSSCTCIAIKASSSVFLTVFNSSCLSLPLVGEVLVLDDFLSYPTAETLLLVAEFLENGDVNVSGVKELLWRLGELFQVFTLHCTTFLYGEPFILGMDGVSLPSKLLERL